MNGGIEKVWQHIHDIQGRLHMIETEVQHLKDARKNMQRDYTPRELCTEYRRQVNDKLDEIKEMIQADKAKTWQIIAPVISGVASAIIIAVIMRGGL